MRDPALLVMKLDRKDRLRAAGEIFEGEVERLAAVGNEQSSDLRFSEVLFKNGASLGHSSLAWREAG